jgi:hypothetical protein
MIQRRIAPLARRCRVVKQRAHVALEEGVEHLNVLQAAEHLSQIAERVAGFDLFE